MRSSALSPTCYRPRLWLWPGQALYVGAPLGLDAHSGSVSCLVVAIGGTFTIETHESPGPAVRSALIPPRLTHRIIADAAQIVFCYLEPGSPRHRSCHHAMTTTRGPLNYRHRHQHTLAASAGTLTDATSARAWLDLATAASPPIPYPTPQVTGDHLPEPFDPRIRQAVAVLHAYDAQDNPSAARLAALVGLSPSRFLHLFRSHTGTSFRRYRQWLRMLRAAALIRDRGELTTTATDAGFASPSHLSSSFHAMFGLPPSHLLNIEIHPPPEPEQPRQATQQHSSWSRHSLPR